VDGHLTLCSGLVYCHNIIDKKSNDLRALLHFFCHSVAFEWLLHPLEPEFADKLQYVTDIFGYGESIYSI
jgi:hypothetical protein